MTPQKPHLLILLILFSWTILRSQEKINPALISSSPYASNWQDSLQQVLEKAGWLNITSDANADRLIVGFENRIYRFEAKAIKELVKIIAPILGGRFSSLDLIVMSRNVPLIGVSLSLDAWRNFQNGVNTFQDFANSIQTTLDIRDDWQRLRARPVRHPGAYRIDAFVDPQLKMALGGYPKPVLAQINLLPTANVFLWRGAQFTAQAVVPIINKIPIPEDKFLRPGLITFNQYFRLPGATFLGLSAGYFTNYSYGAEIELSKIFLNGRIIWRGKAGYTGYASYPQRLRVEKPLPGWQISSLSYVDYQSSIEYRLPKYDLVTKVEAGRFLYFQNAIRVSVVRQFRETDIGFFAVKNSIGSNYGFQVSLPIAPKKYGKPKTVQFRPGKAFNYTYTATQYTMEEYRTGNDIYAFFKKLNPLFIKNQLRQSDGW
jgi:hypothetical protein